MSNLDNLNETAQRIAELFEQIDECVEEINELCEPEEEDEELDEEEEKEGEVGEKKKPKTKGRKGKLPPEIKEQILKEIQDGKKIGAIIHEYKKYGLVYNTVYNWVKKSKETSAPPPADTSIKKIKVTCSFCGHKFEAVIGSDQEKVTCPECELEINTSSLPIIN